MLTKNKIYINTTWHFDHIKLGDLAFHLTQNKPSQQNDHFVLYKDQSLIEQYQAFLSNVLLLSPHHLLELGIWEGGSTVFWHEVFRPTKHIAIDLMDREDTVIFKKYVAALDHPDALKTIWRFDQADKSRLRQLVEVELDGKLDIVLDDASHLYGPTLASFNVLFPLLRPGGFYIIEDWAWEHWEEYGGADHPWASEDSLTQLVQELVEASGTIGIKGQLIQSLTIYTGFVAIERGAARRGDH